MIYLYFKPKIYMPYDISLKKKSAINLSEMRIENGERINLDKVKPKAKRWPNKNFIGIEFVTPLYMNVASIVGKDAVVTLEMKYTIEFGEENITKVIHRQHLILVETTNPHKVIKHYSTSFAAPAIFGYEGKKLVGDDSSISGGSYNKVMQFGLADEDKTTWVIETLDKLHPNCELLHGTTH